MKIRINEIVREDVAQVGLAYLYQRRKISRFQWNCNTFFDPAFFTRLYSCCWLLRWSLIIVRIRGGGRSSGKHVQFCWKCHTISLSQMWISIEPLEMNDWQIWKSSKTSSTNGILLLNTTSHIILFSPSRSSTATNWLKESLIFSLFQMMSNSVFRKLFSCWLPMTTSRLSPSYAEHSFSIFWASISLPIFEFWDHSMSL